MSWEKYGEAGYVKQELAAAKADARQELWAAQLALEAHERTRDPVEIDCFLRHLANHFTADMRCQVLAEVVT